MERARINKTEVAYEYRGAGPVLLLVAGTGYPGATWPPAFVDMLATGFTVVTFDHRGTGSTAGTADAYSTRLFADDALRLLRSLDARPANIVGHSMGGRVAQWMALQRPEAVESLVLVSTGPGPTGAAAHQSRGLPVPTVLRLMDLGYERYIRDLQRRTFFTDPFAAEKPDAVRWLFNAFWENRPSLENYLKHVVARQEHDSVARLSEIKAPALVMVGESDTHAGATGSHIEQSRFLAEYMPCAKLSVIPGQKHGLLWERPAEMAELIGSWMQRHP